MLPQSIWNEVAHHYIVLRLAQQVLDYDRKRLATCKFPELYSLFYQRLENKLKQDLREIKKQLQHHHLKVEEVERRVGNQEIVYLISNGSYSSNVTYWTVALKNATRDYLLSIS